MMISSLDFDEESTFVKRDQPEETQQSQRKLFMDSVLRDLAKHPPENEVWKMSLTMSRPHEYAHDINQFILFSVFMGVKHLEFDFSDPKWEQNGAILFRLPEGVYQQNENLESLKLHLCNLDFTRFASLQTLKTISLGWSIITTDQLRYLVASCPILETLKLKRCVGMKWLCISKPNSMLKNLAFDGCLNSHFLMVQGPKLRMFEYSGKVVQFLMENQSDLVEAHLDFSMHEKFERIGFQLFHLMQQLIAVRFMTVCSAFLQIISTENLCLYTYLNLNVQHLTMNTALHVNEFIGIRFMLGSCTQMNTLTLCLVPGTIFDDYVAPFLIYPESFWSWTSQAETCLLQSLEVLNVRGFGGSPNEMSLIRYIMYFGRCLRSVNLFLVPVQLDNHVMREELEIRSSFLMQSPKANPYLEIFVVRNYL